MALATGGGSIFAYNTANVPTTANESGFVAAINMTGAWLPSGSLDSSITTEKPTVFTDGPNSVSIEPEVDNTRVSAANCSNFSDVATLGTMLNTASNWETNDATPFVQIPQLCDFASVLNVPTQELGVRDVKLFPNPVKNIFSIGSSNSLIVSNLQIFDITGKEVFKIETNQLAGDIDVSFLKTGVYLVKLVVDDQKIVKKLVKL